MRKPADVLQGASADSSKGSIVAVFPLSAAVGGPVDAAFPVAVTHLKNPS